MDLGFKDTDKKEVGNLFRIRRINNPLGCVVIIIAKRDGLFIVQWKANPLLLIEDYAFFI